MCCCCSSFEYDLIAEEYVWRGGRGGRFVVERLLDGPIGRAWTAAVRCARWWLDWVVRPTSFRLEVKVDCTRILGEAVQNDCRLAVVRRVQS